MSDLYVCFSILALQIDSSHFFLRFHIYTLIYNICFSLSDSSLCPADSRSIHISTDVQSETLPDVPASAHPLPSSFAWLPSPSHLFSHTSVTGKGAGVSISGHLQSQAAWRRAPALPQTSGMSLGKSHTLTAPPFQFPYLQRGSYKSASSGH